MNTDKLPAPSFFEKHRDKIAIAGPDECWLWTAGKSDDGYGSVKARGKTRRAHREAYDAENGIGSAAGLVIRHKCDVRACVNPSHLLIGTRADNSRDMVERGRQVCQKGEVNGRAKLTDADVRTIRSEYVPGSRTHGQRAIAGRFGVAVSIIGRIGRREIWGHVS